MYTHARTEKQLIYILIDKFVWEKEDNKKKKTQFIILYHIPVWSDLIKYTVKTKSNEKKTWSGHMNLNIYIVKCFFMTHTHYIYIYIYI